MNPLVLGALPVLLLPIVARAADLAPTPDSWVLHLLSALLGAIIVTITALVAIWRMIVLQRDYTKDREAQDKKCLGCEAKIAACVTKEKFRDIIKPMRAEARHRRRQFNVFGWRMVSVDRKLTALLVKAGLDVREFDNPERPTEDDRGGDDGDDSDLDC